MYTHGHHETVLRSHRWRTAENSAAYLLPELRPGQRLLDVGCGPGTITADLARLVAPGHVTGLDAAPEVLAEAAAALPDATFTTGDVHALEYEDGAFDVVHAHQVLQHLPDPAGALAEMRRVCAPGGVVAARDADYAGMTWYPLLPELDEWLALYRTVARGNGHEPDAGRRLLAWANAAGLTGVRATASVWCYASPADRAWWGGMWADRILNSRLAEQAVSAGHASRSDLERISEGWQRWAASPDGWFLIPHGEILCRV
ncbi:methyltransferase domain-containing protein [Longispora albida]|uniref:methyltransferase domain-containing protein n=1 Tax=Longispora albida TaxID=203523 RepID=UPI00058D58F3|nr:methyltransferase domain-containing protein [Longispora albida]